VARFVTAHPRYRLKRRPSQPWADKAVTTVKLVKADDNPTRLKKEHIEVWTSRVNGDFTLYTGPMGFTDEVEERNGRPVRVLTLSALRIDPNQRYIMVRSGLRDREPDFVNRADRLMELYDANGHPIPATWDESTITPDALKGLLEKHCGRHTGKFEIAPGYALPEGYGKSPGKLSFRFDTGQRARPRALDGSRSGHDGKIVAAKGRQEYVAGSMHPAYPEVRGYWLDQVRRIVAAGVDGVDIRVTNHSAWTVHGAAYGFNEPAVAEFMRRHRVDVLTQPFDRGQWRDLQGEYYTQFLREARALTRKAGVQMQVHVNGLMGFDVPGWERNNVPANFAWQWRTWIEEDLCDSVALKYIPWLFGGRAGMGADFGEQVTRLAKEHNKAVFSHARLPWWVLVNTPGQKAFTQRDMDRLLAQMRWGWQCRLIDGVILYESASFVRMLPDTGETQVSPMMEAILDAVRNSRPSLEAADIRNYVGD